MIINRDLNIDQNNRDYHFAPNCAALRILSCRTKESCLSRNNLKNLRKLALHPP